MSEGKYLQEEYPHAVILKRISLLEYVKRCAWIDDHVDGEWRAVAFNEIIDRHDTYRLDCRYLFSELQDAVLFRLRW